MFVISLESTQNFVINNKVDGKVITPFLNQLIRQEDTYYFNNFYHQTGQGKRPILSSCLKIHCMDCQEEQRFSHMLKTSIMGFHLC